MNCAGLQRSALIGVCGLILQFAAGCGEPPASPMINTVCPIMGGEATSEVTVDWHGRKVGFCCPPCVEEWSELTEAEKEQKIAAANSESAGEHSH